ncbi:MAG: DUF4167 domain-containing protein [Oceanicaulis sp.]|nr:DUF4167 domain-containing protein [Oceanicaulis sp.]
MKRQRGRGRKSGHQNNSNRSFESNGPDVKIRGNAQHIYEKYLQLARDASSSGDRVMAENYFQHAEHYLRIVQLSQPRREETDGDDDRQNDRQQGGQQGHRQDQSRPDQSRSDQSRSDQPRADGDAQRARGNGHDGETGQASGDEDGEAGGRPRRQRTRRRRPDSESDTGASDPLAVVDPEAASQAQDGASAGDSGEQPAPKRARTRRPRADVAAEDALKAAETKSPGGAAA